MSDFENSLFLNNSRISYYHDTKISVLGPTEKNSVEVTDSGTGGFTFLTDGARSGMS